MKAEDLINKHLILEGGSDLAITDGRIYNAFLNALNEAINYTHSCKSDSELLKVLGEHIAEQFDHKAEDVIEQLEWKFKRIWSKEELKDILWSFDDYCKRMEKIYENPRPKQLLIEAFISEYLNQNKEDEV
jgi:hypothetical protein